LRALGRLFAEPPPVELTPVFVEAMKRIAPRLGFPDSFLLRRIDWPFMADLAMRGPLEAYTVQALMRNTISLTMLQSGFKVNVIPAAAEASIDVRLLPGVDTAKYLERLKEKLGDARIAVEILQQPDDAPPSPTTGEAFDAIRKVVAENFSDAIVIPWMTAGGTDSRFLRARGVPAYGLLPIVQPPGESTRIHGVDERISIENLNRGVRTTYRLAAELCAAR
jgi:acetylornithine deacetylase/succinyl-diaminopimelate desuccinylase-like protein